MEEFRVGQRVTDGARRGTVVGTDDASQRVQVIWDDGRGESVAVTPQLRRIGSAACA